MLFPLAVNLAGCRCVCIGGGAVAARRVPSLIAAGAAVTIIAPQLDAQLAELYLQQAVTYESRTYLAGDVAGAFFVLAATGVSDVDATVAAEGLAVGALVCVAGEPSLGNCQFMATIRRGPLLVGLQTGGAAPAMTVALRAHLDQALPLDLEAALHQLDHWRRELQATEPDATERARRWRAVSASGALEAVLSGEGDDALERIRRLLLS